MDRLQPLDLSVNKPAIDFVRAKFRDWYGCQICKQLDDRLNEEVNMRMSTMKPITARWMINLHAYLSSWPNIMVNVTEFTKTDLMCTFSISRNTNLKY